MTHAFRLGLTGSIGMGKSTTAAMFAAEGVPVWDADAAVHRLYATGGGAVGPIAALRPDAIVENAVDRNKLKAWIAVDPTALPQIEAVVHPLVAADRADFLAAHADAGLVVLDVPLLFETGADAQIDGSVVVSAPPEVQSARVMARPGMTKAQFATILAKQMPDVEKRTRATWVIETTSLEEVRAAVRNLIAQIRGRQDA
ncbi:MAG: dephospho-CoA kinase [Paracoccaceae bacterium]|nr:dephospho-CoA kinase [Paracoccaceae bacterium]